jgi:hypothetical protein
MAACPVSSPVPLPLDTAAVTVRVVALLAGDPLAPSRSPAAAVHNNRPITNPAAKAPRANNVGCR